MRAFHVIMAAFVLAGSQAPAAPTARDGLTLEIAAGGGHTESHCTKFPL